MTSRIAILICTHNRPQFLQLLLEGLKNEWQPGVFLAIVDNGTRSSEAIIDPFREQFELVYRRLEEPGLVVARNACLELALAQDPEFLVFIDDDEVPKAGWLASLMRTMRETNADIVTGPVEAKFLTEAPAWAIHGNYFSHDGHSYRTSNLAIRASSFPRDKSRWFQTQFNRLGGEDSELLGRLVEGGALHKVASSAIVTELVPEQRLRRRYLWRCGVRDGAIIAETIFTRHGASASSYGSCAFEAIVKIGYAINHAFWAVRAPWRINSSLRDLHAAAGIALRTVGVKLFFYGG